jgi:hypothetical protein
LSQYSCPWGKAYGSRIFRQKLLSLVQESLTCSWKIRKLDYSQKWVSYQFPDQNVMQNLRGITSLQVYSIRIWICIFKFKPPRNDRKRLIKCSMFAFTFFHVRISHILTVQNHTLHIVHCVLLNRKCCLNCSFKDNSRKLSVKLTIVSVSSQNSSNNLFSALKFHKCFGFKHFFEIPKQVSKIQKWTLRLPKTLPTIAIKRTN